MSSTDDTTIPIPARRNWITAGNRQTVKTANANPFTVVTYNILSDCHMTADTYPYLPNGYRSNKDRHARILAELTHHGESDVICLQEVDCKYFMDTLSLDLSMLGYVGLQANKLCVEEGPAIFYRNSRFELDAQRVAYSKNQIADLVAKETLPSDQSDAILEKTSKETVIMYVRLRCKLTGEVLTLGNVHAYWMNHIAMDVITLQIALASRALLEFAGDANSAVLLCGDFNTEPDMPGYQLLQDGRLSDDSVERLREFKIVPKDNLNEEFTLVDTLAKCYRHPISNLQSAYKVIAGKEVPFSQFHDTAGTDWKLRQESIKNDGTTTTTQKLAAVSGDGTTKPSRKIRALDYLWFNDERLDCDGVLEMVNRDVLEARYACPNRDFPSDHLLMKAQFHFKT